MWPAMARPRATAGRARPPHRPPTAAAPRPPTARPPGANRPPDPARHFRLMTDLQRQTPANPTPPSTGNDWFQGGVNKLEIDQDNPRRIYAAVFGYGLWRSNNGGKTWRQIFHTLNQTDFSN